MNCGSFESFHVSCRWGCSPNALQIRCTADWVSPTSVAIDRVDQCVASFGVVSSVLTITSSTCASVTFRGRPGRGSSSSPRTDRPRTDHATYATVSRFTANRPATSVLFEDHRPRPTTIRRRNASACALVCRRDHDSNCSRSLSASSIGTATGDGIPPSFPTDHELMHHDTSHQATFGRRTTPSLPPASI